jgi:hypothetical protein
MTRFVVGDDRSQSTLFPERLEDYLSEDTGLRKCIAKITVKSVAKCGTSRSPPTRLELLSIEELNIAVHALSRAN